MMSSFALKTRADFFIYFPDRSWRKPLVDLPANIQLHVFDVRQEWSCGEGLNCPLRMNTDGDVQCFSLNGKDCVVSHPRACGQVLQSLEHSEHVNPLTCGSEHLRKWGITGYEDPNHWCHANRNKFVTGHACTLYDTLTDKTLAEGRMEGTTAVFPGEVPAAFSDK